MGFHDRAAPPKIMIVGRWDQGTQRLTQASASWDVYTRAAGGTPLTWGPSDTWLPHFTQSLRFSTKVNPSEGHTLWSQLVSTGLSSRPPRYILPHPLPSWQLEPEFGLQSFVMLIDRWGWCGPYVLARKSEGCGFKSWLSHFLVLGSWVSHSTILSLSLTCVQWDF